MGSMIHVSRGQSPLMKQNKEYAQGVCFPLLCNGKHTPRTLLKVYALECSSARSALSGNMHYIA